MSSQVGREQTRVDKNGRLTKPAEYHEELGLEPGAVVTLVRIGDGLLVFPEGVELQSTFDHVADLFQSVGVSREYILAELARIRQDEFAPLPELRTGRRRVRAAAS